MRTDTRHDRRFLVSFDSLLQMIAKNSSDACSALDKKAKSAQTLAQKNKNAVEKNERESAELSEELKNLRTAEESRRSTIKDLEKKIAKLRPIIGDGTEPEQVDTTELDRKIVRNHGFPFFAAQCPRAVYVADSCLMNRTRKMQR